MKIFFCGSYVPEQIEHLEINISAAGNRFQHNVIENLKECGNEVLVLSYVGMEISEESKKKLKKLNAINEAVRYFLKQENVLFCFTDFLKAMYVAIRESDCSMCYNVVHIWLLLPWFCHFWKKKSILVLADYSGSESYVNIFRKLYAKMQLFCIRHFDCVIGLSPNSRRLLRQRQEFFLMEGGIDEKLYYSFHYVDRSKEKKICILYAGLLDEVTGVDILLEAFSKNRNPDVLLIITGKGPMEERVRAAAKKDERMIIKGNLKYEEYIDELQNADILINPRNMLLPENQNNFPSKIMDYLASGKIIVSTKFAGWEKFNENILFCGSGIEELGICLEEAIIQRVNARDVFFRNREKAWLFEWKAQLKKIFLEMGAI